MKWRSLGISTPSLPTTLLLWSRFFFPPSEGPPIGGKNGSGEGRAPRDQTVGTQGILVQSPAYLGNLETTPLRWGSTLFGILPLVILPQRVESRDCQDSFQLTHDSPSIPLASGSLLSGAISLNYHTLDQDVVQRCELTGRTMNFGYTITSMALITGTERGSWKFRRPKG